MRDGAILEGRRSGHVPKNARRATKVDEGKKNGPVVFLLPDAEIFLVLVMVLLIFFAAPAAAMFAANAIRRRSSPWWMSDLALTGAIWSLGAVIAKVIVLQPTAVLVIIGIGLTTALVFWADYERGPLGWLLLIAFGPIGSLVLLRHGDSSRISRLIGQTINEMFADWPRDQR